MSLEKRLHNLRVVCYDHLRRAHEIYRSQASETDKLTRWDGLVSEMASCPRCQRLQRGETKWVIMNPHPSPSWQGARLVESLPRGSIEFRSLPEARLRVFQEKGLFPPRVLDAGLKEKLFRIEPSERNARPAEVTLADGVVLPRVIFAEWDYVFRWHTPFWQSFIWPDSVIDIGESPFKMPPPVLAELMAVDETSMGTLEFRVTLKDGQQVPCCYGGYNPFIELPSPHQPTEIVGVEIGRGVVAGERAVLDEPDLVWCVYR